jgi:hypothetical protein
VVGHGEHYTSPKQAKRVIQYTVQRLEGILELARGALADGVARPGSEAPQVVVRALGAGNLHAFPVYALPCDGAGGVVYALRAW